MRAVNFRGGAVVLVCVLVLLALYKFSINEELIDNVVTEPVPKEGKMKMCEDNNYFRNKNVYSRDENKWYPNDAVCQGCFNFTKVNLKTQFGQTPIFIYESKNDIWVSGDLKKTGNFEASKSNGIISLLKQDTDINFIDIGANIGVHTLTVAKMGRRVIAVEALHLNTRHLCASVSAGGFEKNVTIVYNAIADGHTSVNLGVDKNNMGGTFVDVDAEHIKKLKLGRAQGTYGTIFTVTMDDILDLPAMKYFNKVLIKMDIEGFEHKAIAKSDKLFQKLNVQGLIMEWEFHRNRKSGEAILQKMKSLNYSPYREENPSAPLKLESSGSWPYDVLWRPNKK